MAMEGECLKQILKSPGNLKWQLKKRLRKDIKPRRAYCKLADRNLPLGGFLTPVFYWFLLCLKQPGLDIPLIARAYGSNFLITELVHQGRLKSALQVCRKAREKSPGDLYLAGVEASLVARIDGWSESTAYWEQLEHIAADRKHGPNVRRPRFLGRLPRVSPFEEIYPGQGVASRNCDARIVVYTSLFGAYDDLEPVRSRMQNLDFVCFTDQDIEVEGWRIVRCEPRFADSNLSAKEYKVLPHRFLQDYDYSLYIDASTWVYDDISPLLSRYLSGEEFVMFRHPDRHCVFEEAEALLVRQRTAIVPLVRQVERYRAEGLPERSGLVEASFIWRRHQSPRLIELMEAWWREIERHGTRDQVSLGYLMWRTDYYPRVLSDLFGSARLNAYFLKKPHTTHERPHLSLPASAELVFLYHPGHEAVASTKMRGNQLADLINRHSVRVRARSSADLGVRGAAVVLTKGLLKELSAEQAKYLRDSNYLIAADYVDDHLRKDLDRYIDIYIASSIAAYHRLLSRKSHKWVFLITHHADPRLPDVDAPQDHLRTGYFGQVMNVLYQEELAQEVDFHSVRTKVSSSDWLDKIGNYNFHYAVRKHRHIDGAKPFLKGFTAAHCGANILVNRTDGDARYYLPPDYPFFIEDDALDTVRQALGEARKYFGGDSWRYAMEAMASVRRRSSVAQVISEVESMLAGFRTGESSATAEIKGGDHLEVSSFPVSNYRPGNTVFGKGPDGLYPMPHVFHFARFADVTGDGIPEVFYFKGTCEQVAYDKNGRELWRYFDPEADARGPLQRPRPDSSVPVFDFLRNGTVQAACMRIIRERLHLCLIDARSGDVIASNPIQEFSAATKISGERPELRSSIVPIQLDGPGEPYGILLHRDYDRVEAYGIDLQLRWVREIPELGHTSNTIALGETGREGIFTGTRLIDADGVSIWEHPEWLEQCRETHCDSNLVCDLDGNGEPDLVFAPNLAVLDARGNLKWERSDLACTEVQSVRLLKNMHTGKHSLCFSDHYNSGKKTNLWWRGYRSRDVSSRSYVLDHAGKLRFQFEGLHTPLSGDWDGDGEDEVFNLMTNQRVIEVYKQDGRRIDEIPVQERLYISDMAVLPLWGAGHQLVTHEWNETQTETCCVIYRNLAAADHAVPVSSLEMSKLTCY